MEKMPQAVVDLLEKALVAELTVIDAKGHPRTDPLIPFWDGEKVLMTSSVLFSRKLEDLKRNSKVSISLSDPVGVPADPFSRATIQGDARIVEDDLHDGWGYVLPLWLKKEPVVRSLLKLRFALPLFWERSVIEITPRRVLWWEGGDTAKTPIITELGQVAE